MTAQTDHTTRPARAAKWIFQAGFAGVAVAIVIQFAEWVPPTSLRLTGGRLNLSSYAVVVVLTLALAGAALILSSACSWLVSRYGLDGAWVRPGYMVRYGDHAWGAVVDVSDDPALRGPWVLISPAAENAAAFWMPARDLSEVFTRREYNRRLDARPVDADGAS